MPKYIYQCDKCDKIFEVVHSIENKLEDCEECKGYLIRIPSSTFIFNSEQKRGFTNRKVGDLTKDHIEESRRELRKEQERLTLEEYK